MMYRRIHMIIFYRKKGFKVYKLANQSISDFDTKQLNVSLQVYHHGERNYRPNLYIARTRQRRCYRKSLSGILRRRHACGTLQKPVVTEYQTFSVLPDGTELPNGTTYKVEPACPNVCTSFTLGIPGWYRGSG